MAAMGGRGGRVATRAASSRRRAAAARRPSSGRAERSAPRTAPAEALLAPLPSVATVDLAAALGGDLMALPALPQGAGGSAMAAAPAAASRPFAALSRSATGLIDALVDRARGQLGTRYVLGGNRPGESLDCSSFARYAMEALGFRLPRTADEQARLGRAVPRDRAALKPGDLLTFGSRRRVDHVGIYLGEGRFIHASVKSGRVIETTIERNGSLFSRWLGARRLIADSDTSRGDGG
jgi:cell wall-associated NlpC family hydrolase